MGKVLHFTISIPATLVAAVVALSALTLRLPSRLVALYYQEQGARALARALLAEGRAGEGGGVNSAGSGEGEGGGSQV